MKTFHEVVGESVVETQRKFYAVWTDADIYSDAVCFALGLFAGIVDRRMHELPDPDPYLGKENIRTEKP